MKEYVALPDENEDEKIEIGKKKRTAEEHLHVQIHQIKSAREKICSWFFTRFSAVLMLHILGLFTTGIGVFFLVHYYKDEIAEDSQKYHELMAQYLNTTVSSSPLNQTCSAFVSLERINICNAFDSVNYTQLTNSCIEIINQLCEITQNAPVAGWFMLWVGMLFAIPTFCYIYSLRKQKPTSEDPNLNTELLDIGVRSEEAFDGLYSNLKKTDISLTNELTVVRKQREVLGQISSLFSWDKNTIDIIIDYADNSLPLFTVINYKN